MNIQFQTATIADAAAIATMNQCLIHDEGHRNTMTLQQLTDRMKTWLNDEYQAMLFQVQGKSVGYCLFRGDPEWIYVRQFFVAKENRRSGIGRYAFQWLRENQWDPRKRLRLEVLCHNHAALSFWRAMGFSDYCVTLEFPGKNL